MTQGAERPDIRRVEEMESCVFEIGLVLAGAVSAGAYTAGVLDYLTEALDAWEKAKASEIQEKGPDPKNWSIPGHKIRIRVLSGASAGSMCGAILAVASHWDFPHVNALNHEDVGADNPFFAAWVKGIDIIKLLGDSDLNKEEEPSRVVSILNSDPIIQIGQNALSYRCQKPIDRRFSKTHRATSSHLQTFEESSISSRKKAPDPHFLADRPFGLQALCGFQGKRR